MLELGEALDDGDLVAVEVKDFELEEVVQVLDAGELVLGDEEDLEEGDLAR